MLEVHDEPYKESYTIQVNTDNIALYIWIEAIGIQVTIHRYKNRLIYVIQDFSD